LGKEERGKKPFYPFRNLFTISGRKDPPVKGGLRPGKRRIQWSSQEEKIFLGEGLDSLYAGLLSPPNKKRHRMTEKEG